jgi:hypothetical protein
MVRPHNAFLLGFLKIPSCKFARWLNSGEDALSKDREIDIAGGAPEAQRDEALMLVGAIYAGDSIASALASQTMRNLQRFRDKKLYKALGFNRFEDFLDSDQSRMNYAKFNRLEKAIEREGDELFDYLQAIDAPLSKRKLLGKGEVCVEGKELVLQTGNDEETRIPLNNQTRILGVITRLVEQNNERGRKIKRGEARNKTLKEQVEELKKGNGHGGSKDGFYDALLNVIGAMSVLAVEAEKVPENERRKQRKAVNEAISEHLKRVDVALGLAVPDQVKKRNVRVPDHLLEEDEE